ncbi:MAG TPA: hypothetical protein VL424_07845, partial [Pararobbsia sp.]|nr:hypothetical protein [Pararobbsia sp.]
MHAGPACRPGMSALRTAAYRPCVSGWRLGLRLGLARRACVSAQRVGRAVVRVPDVVTPTARRNRSVAMRL